MSKGKKVTKADFDVIKMLQKAGVNKSQTMKATKRSWNVVAVIWKMDNWSQSEFREKYDLIYNPEVKPAKTIETQDQTLTQQLDRIESKIEALANVLSDQRLHRFFKK